LSFNKLIVPVVLATALLADSVAGEKHGVHGVEGVKNRKFDEDVVRGLRREKADGNQVHVGVEPSASAGDFTRPLEVARGKQKQGYSPKGPKGLRSKDPDLFIGSRETVSRRLAKCNGNTVSQYYANLGKSCSKNNVRNFPDENYCNTSPYTISVGGETTNPLTLANPNCCELGFAYGIKVFNGDTSGNCGDECPQDMNTGLCEECSYQSVGDDADSPRIEASCLDSTQITVTFPECFSTGDYVIFRKNQAPHPAEHFQCGTFQTTGPTTISFDNGERCLVYADPPSGDCLTDNPNFIRSAKGTSHLDICWNGVPGGCGPSECVETTCAAKNVQDSCVKFSCTPPDGDSTADPDGCYEILSDTANVCLDKNTACATFECVATGTQSADLNGCAKTAKADNTKCDTVGVCGVKLCSNGLCGDQAQYDANFNPSTCEAGECQENKCDADTFFVCATQTASDGAACGTQEDCNQRQCFSGSCSDNYLISGAICPNGNGDTCCDGVTGTCAGPTACPPTCPCEGVDPVLTGEPEDANPTIEACGSLPDVTVTAGDCGNIPTTVTLDEGFSPTSYNNCDGYTVTRTWTARNCGGETASIQTVTVELDETGPLLTGTLANLEYRCDELNMLPKPATTLFTDCSVPLVVELKSQTPISGDEAKPAYCRMETLEWTATDACGNPADYTQSLEITKPAPDVKGPVSEAGVSCAVKDNLGTDSDPILTPSDSYVASNTCEKFSDLVWSYSDAVIGGDENPNCRTFTRTWTATDKCEQSDTTTQDITIFDDEDPTFERTTMESYTCSDNVPSSANGKPMGGDNCASTVSVTLKNEASVDDLSVPDTCANKKTITRTWTLDDGCGNSVDTDEIIQVSDTDAPDVTQVPPTANDACPDTVPSNAGGTVSDNCDDTNVKSSYENTGALSPKTGEGTTCNRQRKWFYEDQCGNKAAPVVQVVTIDDNVPPQFVETPSPLQFYTCEEETTADNLSVTNDCNEPDETIAAVDSPSTSIDGGISFERTWSASDNCGNTNEFVQTVNVYDVCTFTGFSAFSGDDLLVEVSMTNNVEPDGTISGVVITLKVIDGTNTGDLRGFYWSVEGVTFGDDDGDFNENDIQDMGTPITDKAVRQDDVISFPKGNTMNGDGNDRMFDAGISIGNQGLKGGSDDYDEITFTVSGISTDNIVGDVGIRVQSVGLLGGSRDGSSKIITEKVCCPNEPSPPTPECDATTANCCPDPSNGCTATDCGNVVCEEQCVTTCVCDGDSGTNEGPCSETVERRGLAELLW